MQTAVPPSVRLVSRGSMMAPACKSWLRRAHSLCSDQPSTVPEWRAHGEEWQ
jgi:hypothetical protein